MVDVTRTLNLPSSMSATVTVVYVLYLPEVIRVYDQLAERSTCQEYQYGSFWMDSTKMYIPLDLITAARLKLIKPFDDSGIGEEQWAWLKLIGLVKGEN